MKSQFTNEQVNEVMQKRGGTRKAALRWLNRHKEDRPKRKAAVAPAVDVKQRAANDKPEVVITKDGLAARKAGLALFIKAGRPSHSDFRKVFGADGPKLTWQARAEKLGIPTAEECAAQFPALLKRSK